MATTREAIDLLALTIGADIKSLTSNIGTLANLSTTDKSNLVLALNEIDGKLKALDLTSIIQDDTVGTTSTYSSEKIVSEINAKVSAAKDELLGGAGDAVDTLKELADLIQNNKDLIDALNGIAAKSVRVDQAQDTFTTEEKKQGRDNIGAAAASDLEALTARVTTAETAIAGHETRIAANETAIAGNTSAISDLNASLGDIANADFVATYNNAKAGTAA